jgi:nucleotidyltransferase substrate binding protein (TIGR01987 family)
MKTARAALATLEELVGLQDVSNIKRDAAIQRFEYTFEAVWKMARVYLRDLEGLDVGSPKRAIRGCYQVGLLSEDQTHLGLQMVDDRNSTSHTYHEQLAEKIYHRLGAYVQLMEFWLDAMSSSADKQLR